MSCRLKWCTTNSSIQSTMIHSVHLYTDTMWIFFASKLINVKQLLSSTYQILFINVLYFTHNLISSFCCRLDALRAGILEQRSSFMKLVYSIGEEIMLTWTVVFIFLWFPGLPFSSSFYRVYSWDMYLHLVHFIFFLLSQPFSSLSKSHNNRPS